MQVVVAVATEARPQQSTDDISLDSSLDRDLGLDSLARVQLIDRLEQGFDVSLPERVFGDAETPRDLLRAIRAAVPDGEGIPAPSRVATSPSSDASSIEKPTGISAHAETLTDVLRWHVEHSAERTHIHLYSDKGTGETLTYGALWEEAMAAAAGLQRLGVESGQTVAIMLPTGRAYFVSFFAVLLAGGVPVPIYPPVRANQLAEHLRRHRRILVNCGARVLITVDEARRLARLLQSQVETIRAVETVQSLSAEGGYADARRPSAHDTAFLQYTSGSTGDPKGVTLSHANLLANIRAMGASVKASSADVFVSWLPLYHDMGLIGAWLGSLYFAAPLVVMSPLAFLSRPARWLRAIDRYRGTVSASPNFGYELCLKTLREKDLADLDLSSWRAAFNGAEPVSPETMERFCARLAGSGFRREAMMPVYGLAECSVGLAFPPLGRGPRVDAVERRPFMNSGRAVPAKPEDTAALRFVGCGAPIPGHEVRVVDATGRELADRTEGQVEFRGPSATSGYHRNPQATRTLFHDDWLRTGDLGYTESGELFITGRQKDVIIRGGRNIYPHEIEEAVGQITGIRDGRVAVFGSADPETGTDRLVVLAETRQDDRERRAALQAEVNALVVDLLEAPPDDVVLVPAGTVLKTSSGKVRRAASRSLYESGRIGTRQAPVWLQLARQIPPSVIPSLRRTWRAAAAGLYATWVWTTVGLIAPLTGVLLVLVPRLPWRWALAKGGVRLLAGLAAIRHRVEGQASIPQDRPCVFVSNHASYLDAFFLATVFAEPVSYVAKSELLGNALARPPLHAMRTEFVERFERSRGAEDTERLTALARAGRRLLFFPEATFTRVPGLRGFYMGAFLVAAEARCTVVPIGIRGTRSILRARSWFPRPGAVSIAVGTPIEPAPEGTGDAWQEAVRLRDAARAEVLRLCGEPDLGHEYGMSHIPGKQ